MKQALFVRDLQIPRARARSRTQVSKLTVHHVVAAVEPKLLVEGVPAEDLAREEDDDGHDEHHQEAADHHLLGAVQLEAACGGGGNGEGESK